MFQKADANVHPCIYQKNIAKSIFEIFLFLLSNLTRLMRSHYELQI